MPTGISYCDETWNPVVGCSPVSEGCRNCYAMSVAHRGMCEQHKGLTDADGKWTGEVRLVPEALERPLRTKAPKTWLTPSMGDMFHEDVPNEYIAAWFGVMASSPAHTFLVLTKKVERVLRWLRWMDNHSSDCAHRDPAGDALGRGLVDFLGLDLAEHICNRWPPGYDWWPLPNVLIGTTVENQRRADQRLPVLAEIAALGWRTWASLEPLLEDLGGHQLPHARNPEFIAVGAETGPGARPCEEAWIRSVVEQCKAAGVRCHVKQVSARSPDPDTWPEDLRVRDMP